MSDGIPHARGGEPGYEDKVIGECDVFPTHVGVNRCLQVSLHLYSRIPHARGGEPNMLRNRLGA